MQENVARRKQIIAQLASMDASVEEGLLITMFVQSFGDWFNSPFGSALSALLTRGNLTWQLATLRLLQQLTSQQSSRLMVETCHDKALVAQQNRNMNDDRGSSSGTSMECCYCDKTSRSRRDTSSGIVTSQNMTRLRRIRKTSVGSCEGKKQPTEMALPVPRKSFIDSESIRHMMKHVSVTTGKTVSSDIMIETPGKNTARMTARGESAINVPGR